MSVLLAHPGTQHAPHLARELSRRGLLGGYWTGVAAAEGSTVHGLLKFAGRLPGARGLGSRIVSGIPSQYLHTVPGPELRALWRMRRGGDGVNVFHARNEAFQHAIPDSALRASSSAIGFDTSSAILAERARRFDLPLFLDRTIAHPAALPPLLAKLGKLYPDWTTCETPRPDFLIRAEAQEHALARRIVVGGSFARATLIEAGLAPERIVVNPYGADWDAFALPPVKDGLAAPGSGRPLRFLYVGSVIARKGVPVLLDAWKRLAPRDAELWIAGGVGPRERKLIPELPGLRVLGQVAKADMPALYASADVFVLPSLFEGFGLVILEALAAGLPVISTPHTGAVEAVDAPALGRLVPVLDAEALGEAMRAYLDAPPDRAAVRAAAQTIRPRFTWEAYGDRWADLLATTC